MLTPSIGFCAIPLTNVGWRIPAASRIVGAMSMTWWNCERNPPLIAIRAGQETIRGLRVPPKWEAICLVHWKGVLIAQAQPTAKWGRWWGRPLGQVGLPVLSSAGRPLRT